MNKHIPTLIFSLAASCAVINAADITGLRPGGLKDALTGATDTRTLILSGTIDASDFATLLYDVNDLQTLNLTNVTIAPYQGSPLPYTMVKSSPANAIPPYALTGLTSLSSVTLPATLEEIGTGAFSGSGLSSIVIPQSVSQIDPYAFMRCANLTSVSIPSSVEIIGERAFAYCPKLASVTIDENDRLQTLPQGLFEACGGIKQLNLEALAQCAEIGPWALAECNGMTTLVLPDVLETIGESAFTGDSKVSALILPPTLSSIDSEAMMGMTSLALIKGEGLTGVPALGDDVWRDVDQKAVTLVVSDEMERSFLNTPQWQSFNIVPSSEYETSTDDIKLSLTENNSVKVEGGNIIVSSSDKELGTVAVYNYTGHMVASVKAGNSAKVIISADGWNPGVYLVVSNAGVTKIII